MRVARIRHKRNRWIYIFLFIILIVSIGAIFVYSIFNASPASAPESVNQIVEVEPIEPKPIAISSDVLFGGNIYWGRYINQWSMASDLKYSYPFSRLDEFNRDEYNAWIAGLECPVVAGIDISPYQENATLQFNCSPDYLPEAAKWFTAVTLANNHTDNQGVDGFAETKQNLDKNGIQYFGHYDPAATGENCEVIGLPVSVAMNDDSMIEGEVPVAMCGYHGVFKIPPQSAIDEIKQYSAYMPVIAMPHMGAEYRASADSIRTTFYRKLIDNGADAVLGDHPHWIQNSESYKGHLIVYSMGNFMFDQQDTTEVTRSAAIKLHMTVGEDSELESWLELGKLCEEYHDDCLDQIKKEGLSKLDYKYQFSVVGTNSANKITKPATEQQQAAILERLDWQNTLKGLQLPYSGL